MFKNLTLKTKHAEKFKNLTDANEHGTEGLLTKLQKQGVFTWSYTSMDGAVETRFVLFHRILKKQ